MLGFNTEAQGWLPCKITEEDQEGALWTVDWWDESREDRLKREEELRPFEETGWWYRITGQEMSQLSKLRWDVRAMTHKGGMEGG